MLLLQTMMIVFEVVIAFPLFIYRMYLFIRKRRGGDPSQEAVGGEVK